MTSFSKSPILLLQQIELRSQQRAHGLPQQLEVKSTWDGIGFRLGEQVMVAPMEHIIETLAAPAMARVPGAQPWVRGIANVRGTLLPILDLKGFVFGKNSELHRHSRIMVVNHQGNAAGFLVDEVYGLRHFFEEDYQSDGGITDQQIMPFIKGAYRRNRMQWAVFDLLSVVEHPEFRRVAA